MMLFGLPGFNDFAHGLVESRGKDRGCWVSLDEVVGQKERIAERIDFVFTLPNPGIHGGIIIILPLIDRIDIERIGIRV